MASGFVALVRFTDDAERIIIHSKFIKNAPEKPDQDNMKLIYQVLYHSSLRVNQFNEYIVTDFDHANPPVESCDYFDAEIQRFAPTLEELQKLLSEGGRTRKTKNLETPPRAEEFLADKKRKKFVESKKKIASQDLKSTKKIKNDSLNSSSKANLKKFIDSEQLAAVLSPCSTCSTKDFEIMQLRNENTRLKEVHAHDEELAAIQKDRFEEIKSYNVFLKEQNELLKGSKKEPMKA